MPGVVSMLAAWCGRMPELLTGVQVEPASSRGPGISGYAWNHNGQPAAVRAEGEKIRRTLCFTIEAMHIGASDPIGGHETTAYVVPQPCRCWWPRLGGNPRRRERPSAPMNLPFVARPSR
jgi:hypothetical protein